MKHVMMAGAAVLFSLFAAQTPASAAAGPNAFTIRSISFAGTGCQAGTVATNVSEDLQAFTLLFDSYVAEIGPGVPFGESRKNCQLAISFDCPAGWQYALVSLDTRGYAALDSGVQGLQKTSFYFQGSAQTGSVERPFYGPSDDDYQVRDIIPATSRPVGKCGSAARALNVNTQVRMTSGNPNAQGLMTVDSIDGELHESFGLEWSRVSN